MIELLFTLLLTQSQPKIIFCTIGREPNAGWVYCPTAKNDLGEHWWFAAGADGKKMQEWQLRAPMADGGVHPDGQLYKVELKSGDIVKFACGETCKSG